MNNDYVKYVEPPTTTEILARSGEFYIEEVDSPYNGRTFTMQKENAGIYGLVSHGYSKSELVSEMKHQLWVDTKKLNELQPKVKALRALLQELDNNGGDE